MAKWNNVYFRPFRDDDGSYPITGHGESECFYTIAHRAVGKL